MVFRKGQVPWVKGKKHSTETLLKISKSSKGKEAWNKGKKGVMPTPWNKGKKGLQVAWNKGKTGIYTEELRKRHSDFMKEYYKTHKSPLLNKHPSEKSKKRMSESAKRAWINPELRKKQTESHKGKPSPMKGKHQSEEAKKIHSDFMKEYYKTNPPWNKGKKGLQVAWNKGIPMNEDLKIKFNRTGKTPWNKGKKFPELSEWARQQILKQYESGLFPKQENTKPERQVKEELIKRGYKEEIDFIHQYKLVNKFMCDFCFPSQKLIVEVYGDYWHCNQKIYRTPKNQLQKNSLNQDKKKEAYITKIGWTYLVLWECDIKKDVAKCVDKIEESLKEKDNKSV